MKIWQMEILRVMGGNTRKYLYYFAIMFDMSEALKKNDHYNEDTKEVETEFGKRADMQAYLLKTITVTTL